MSPDDFPPSRDELDIYLLINDSVVYTARPLNGFPRGQISLSDPQRTTAQVALTDTVNVQIYDPFAQGRNSYLGAVDVEVGFAGRNTTETPYDQDELAHLFTRVFLVS